MNFGDLDKQNTRVKEAIADSKNRPIVFFGTGLFFGSFDKCLAEHGISYVAADNDPKKWGGTLAGDAPIISPQEMTEKYMDSCISIAINDTRFYDEIYAQIIGLGFSPDKILSFTEIVCFVEHKRLEAVYEMLCDDESRAVLRAAYTSDFKERISNLKKLNNGEQYFPGDIIKLTDHEIFIDVGAYIGDTVDAFIRHTGGRFKAIHSFEPSEKNAREYLKNHSGDGRITLRQTGLGSKNTSAKFNDDGSGGQVRANGSETIQIERLDDVLSGGGGTFIKMDIEGSEFNALNGAERTIRKFKPKLAICVYHKADDVINIAPYIKKLVPEYKLFLRQHSDAQYETVLYAVADGAPV